MNSLAGIIFIAFAVLLFLVFIKRDTKTIKSPKKTGSTPTDNQLQYFKKLSFLNNSEHRIFIMLQKIIGDKYYIFPQVHYSKFIYAQGQQNYHNPLFNKIDRKSADFVLFDKQNISPVLVIEVDGPSHNKPHRIERDKFINKVLKDCGVEIIRISPSIDRDLLNKITTL
jgi:hypothetical protein